MFNFENPINLFFILFSLPIIFFYFKKNNFIRLNFSVYSGVEFSKKNNLVTFLNFFYKLLNILCLLCLILALSKPFITKREEIDLTDGFNIMIVLDISPTMLALDYSDNDHTINNLSRLEAAKNILVSFVKKRKNDNIGITAFASDAFLYSPLSKDYNFLISKIKALKVFSLGDGSAIGFGISTALYHLQKQKNKKIIILVTDGINNNNEISYKSSIDLALNMNVKIYTIGLGRDKKESVINIKRNGKYYSGKVRNSYNEKILKEIAAKTGGEYFNAYNNNILENIFNFLDSKEASKRYVKINSLKDYKYDILLNIAIILAIIAFIIKEIILKTPL